MNYYGTQEYLDYINDLNERVFSKIDFSEPTRENDLGEGYLLRGYCYDERVIVNKGFALPGCEICRLFHNGKFIYEWKNTDRQSRLSTIVHHSNGMDYLVFDEDLYGYSVLNLTTGESMHYIPDRSAGETFIWCECHYNPETEQLAVGGCYWAHPYSVIVVDFSNPLVPVEYYDWAEVYRDYDYDIDFVRWEGKILRCRVSDDAADNSEMDPSRVLRNVILDT